MPTSGATTAACRRERETRMGLDIAIAFAIRSPQE
jgi:hypothetical protein